MTEEEFVKFHELCKELDPCCGTGVLSKAAKERGYNVAAYDIHDWGYEHMSDHLIDFLELNRERTYAWRVNDFTILMNPPFSKAVEFVEKAFELGAKKVACFQRLAWYESSKRREFWENNPPARVYVCGDRATCWRHDVPDHKRSSNAPTAHAWFIWEQGAPSGTLLSHIYKND